MTKWSYASPDYELDAIRWYLTGRLDAETKLDSALGTAVNAYEYLRHAIELPALRELSADQKFLHVPRKFPGGGTLLSPDPETGQWLETTEFPQLPFTKLSPISREAVLVHLYGEYPAFWPADIIELVDWGVLEELSKLAKKSKQSEETVTGEIEVFEQTSVIPFTVDFGSGYRRAERSCKRWLKENKHRFARNGRSLAGTRARDNPCSELKDLAAARLLFLNDFDRDQANKWTWQAQPRNSKGNTIPWFNTKRKTRCRVFKDLRDWTRALARFEKNLQAYLPPQ